MPGRTDIPRICPLFETQRKRSIAAARKAADGGMAQDRSKGGPHVPRLCGRTPLAAAGFRAADPSQRYSPDARAAPTVSRSCRGVSRVVADQTPSRPNELLRVHSSPIRRHARTAASTTRLGHGRTVRDALQTFRDQTEFPPARGFRSTASAPSVSFSDRAQPNYNKASVSRRSDDAGSPAALTMTPTTCLGGIHLKNRT